MFYEDFHGFIVVFIAVFVEMLFRKSMGNLWNDNRRRHNGLHINNEQKDGKTYQTISWDGVSDYMLFMGGGYGLSAPI